MTPDDRRATAAELRDVSARGRRLFRSAGRGGESAVDLLDEMIRDIERVAKRLDPPPESRTAPANVVEGRFTTGTIAAKGRMVRVEIRHRRRVA